MIRENFEWLFYNIFGGLLLGFQRCCFKLEIVNKILPIKDVFIFIQNNCILVVFCCSFYNTLILPINIAQISCFISVSLGIIKTILIFDFQTLLHLCQVHFLSLAFDSFIEIFSNVISMFMDMIWSVIKSSITFHMPCLSLGKMFIR